MAKQNSFSPHENALTSTDVAPSTDQITTPKKQFIEPEISTPVDVLEATTFFQPASSGATN